MRQLIAGNWKMNGTGASLKEIEAVARAAEAGKAACDILICPPATLIAPAMELRPYFAPWFFARPIQV